MPRGPAGRRVIAFRIAAWLVMTAFAAMMIFVLTAGLVAALKPQALRSVQLRGWPPYQSPSCTWVPDWSDARFSC